MRATRLQGALERLTGAIRDVEFELLENESRAGSAGVAHLCFTPPLPERHRYKSGKRREMTARLSFDTACDLGFRGSLDDWERLMGAVARR